MTDEEAVAQGHEAENEWRHTKAAFAAVEAAIIREISATPIGQETKVLNLHKSLQALAGVRTAVLGVIQTGQIAEVALEQAGVTAAN